MMCLRQFLRSGFYVKSNLKTHSQAIGLAFCRKTPVKFPHFRFARIQQNSNIAFTDSELKDCKNIDEEKLNESTKKLIQMEYEAAKVLGQMVPSVLKEEDLNELLKLDSAPKRAKYMKFLFKREKIKGKTLAKKQKKQQLREENKPHLQELKKTWTDYDYCVSRNTLFIIIRKNAITNFYRKRQVQSLNYGQDIIIDMDFDRYMTKQYHLNTAEQIRDGYAFNRTSPEPFNMHLCNAKLTDPTMSFLQKVLQNFHSHEVFLNHTEKNYLDLYPKEKLVYLTPNASEELRNFDHDAVYIIGGYVDKEGHKQLTLAKAKREKLKMYKLPLDYYLPWGCGIKSLTINQVMNIMVTMKDTGSWREALKHVPTRKLKKLALESDE